MGISKITRNYQVTLPKDVRELKGLRVGERVLFVVEGDRVDLVKLEDDLISKTAGIWTAGESGADYQRRLRREWQKRRF